MKTMNEYRQHYPDLFPLALTLCNRKGGSGKTTCALSLAWTFSQAGFRTLLIDMDPQASATQLLGINRAMKDDDPLITARNLGRRARQMKDTPEPFIRDSLYGLPTEEELVLSEHTGVYTLFNDILDGMPVTRQSLKEQILTPQYTVESVRRNPGAADLRSIQAAIEVHRVNYGFDLLNSSEELNELELNLTFARIPNKAGVLRTIVQAVKRADLYDVILIDTPPSLGALSINALETSDGNILVGMADEQTLFSVAKIKKNIRDLKVLSATQSGILGFVFTAVDASSPGLKDIMEYKIKHDLHLYCFQTSVPRTVKIPRANTTRRLPPMDDKRLQKVFADLAEEILEQADLSLASEEAMREKIRQETDRIMRDVNSPDPPQYARDILEQAQHRLAEELQGRVKPEDLTPQQADKLLQSCLQKQIQQTIRTEITKGELQ